MKTFRAFFNESNKMTISKGLYGEFIALEADTVDPGYSPKEKEELADALYDAKKKGSRYEISLSPRVKKYVVDKAIPNMKDIAQDKNKKALVNQLDKLKTKLHEEAPAVNTASVGVTADDVKNIGPRKKKRKPKVLTRNYIEVMGKRKRVRN